MTTLVKRNNGLSILPELPSVFNDSLLRDWFNWPSLSGGALERGTIPAINILETEHNYEIWVAAPGMNKEDFKVELENNRLLISGEKKPEQEQREGTYLRREFNYHSFMRSFTLSEKHVNGEKIYAKYSDGILYIAVPKSDEAKSKPVRVIPIT